MLRSIKQLYGNKLGASDGEIGHVKDCYFDDRNWAVRYLIVDTGSWLPGRQVLISPYALGRLDPAERILRANLTRKQIEDSPAMEEHKPVSRQFEEQYHRYFGWPCYWEIDALWGLSDVQIREQPVEPLPGEPAAASRPRLDRTDGQLRSTLAVNGYHLQASDGVIGHVCDFLMNPQSWAIDMLVIKTGHRLSGSEVRLRVDKVDRISWEESTVLGSLTWDADERSPTHLLDPFSVAH